MKDLLTWVLVKLRLRNLPQVRRIIVAVVGATVLLLGIALLVLPGPAILVIPIGLSILATEFVWARRLLEKARQLFRKKGGPPEPAQKQADSQKPM